MDGYLFAPISLAIPHNPLHLHPVITNGQSLPNVLVYFIPLYGTLSRCAHFGLLLL
jgi:hypothetical protein